MTSGEAQLLMMGLLLGFVSGMVFGFFVLKHLVRKK